MKRTILALVTSALIATPALFGGFNGDRLQAIEPDPLGDRPVGDHRHEPRGAQLGRLLD